LFLYLLKVFPLIFHYQVVISIRISSSKW